jgi:DNA polymerase-3 subunit beta
LIAGESASEYPTIVPVEKKTAFNLDATSLLSALHLVTFASAKTSLRPVLSGVFLRSEKGKLILVATDSYRLSECSIPTSMGEEEISCIIPVKVLDELKMILGSKKGASKADEVEGEEEKDKKEKKEVVVEVILSTQQIELHVGSTKLLSRLIEGKFPNYQQILPKTHKSRVMLPIKELTTVSKRMHYFVKEMNNTLAFHVSSGQVQIATPATQLGKDEATLVVEVEGEGGKIALSSSYLLDFLAHIDGEHVEFSLVDSLHPAVFHLPTHPQFLHLIMPLRMQEE